MAVGTAPRAATGRAPRGRATDRRQSFRHALGSTGTVTLDARPGRAKYLQVIVRDVSLRGVMFRSPVSFDEGARHELRIGSGSLHLSSAVEVARCRERDDGTYDVGAKFA